MDSAGRGYAQPDYFFLCPQAVVCIEAKLTQKYEGVTQITQLYRPLLRHIYKLPVVAVLACHNLTKDPGRWAIKNPKEVLSISDELTFTWHFLG